MNAAIEWANGLAGHWARGMWPVLWQTAALAVIVGLIVLCARRMSPALRFWLWMLVPLRLLVMPLIVITLPVLANPPEPAVAPSPIVSQAPVEAQAPDWTAQPMPPAERRSTAVQRHARASIWTWLMAGWVAGIGIFSLRLARGWLRMKGIAGQARENSDARVRDCAREAAAMLGLRKMPRIMSAEEGVSPFVLGFFRPVVVLPAALADHVSPEELRAVLAHEFAHVRRRDALVGWVLACSDVIYFFNPVVHLVKRVIILERERACDEQVLALAQAPRAVYARALLSATGLNRPAAARTSCAPVLLESSRHLERRLKSIAAERRPCASLSRKAKFVLLAIAILVLPGVTLTTRSAAAPATSAESQPLKSPAQGSIEIKDINAKVAQLKLENATRADVIAIFGEPASYIWGKKTFNKDNLPDFYIMFYSRAFSVFMRLGQIEELRFEDRSDYVFHGALRFGSTLDEALKVIGPPDRTVEGGKIAFEDGVLYKNAQIRENGEKGVSYYARRGQGIRIFAFHNVVSALYLTRKGPPPAAPTEKAADDAEMMKQCDRNLGEIVKGIITYQGQNNDNLPSSLADLFPKYLDDPKVLICPADKSPMKIGNGLPCSYRYIGNVPWRDLAVPGEIIAYDHAEHDGGRNVAYFDGHIGHVAEQDFTKHLAELYERLKPLMGRSVFSADRLRDRVEAFCGDKDFPEFDPGMPEIGPERLPQLKLPAALPDGPQIPNAPLFHIQACMIQMTPSFERAMGITGMLGKAISKEEYDKIIREAKPSAEAIIISSPATTGVSGLTSGAELSTSGTYVSDYKVEKGIAVPVLSRYRPDRVVFRARATIKGETVLLDNIAAFCTDSKLSEFSGDVSVNGGRPVTVHLFEQVREIYMVASDEAFRLRPDEAIILEMPGKVERTNSPLRNSVSDIREKNVSAGHVGTLKCYLLVTPGKPQPTESGLPAAPAEQPHEQDVKAKASPEERDSEARLDQKIKAVSLPGVSLPEAVEILKTQIGKDVNFLLDSDPALKLSNVQVRLDLRDATLSTVLHAILHFQKPSLDFATTLGVLYISTPEGCKAWSAHAHDHDNDASRLKTREEIALAKRLDMEIKAVSLPGVSLLEAIEILKTQIGRDVNFALDPAPALKLSSVQVQLDLKNVTVRTLLYAMLRNQKPTLDYVIALDMLYISSPEGCAAWAAHAHDHDKK